MSRLDPKPNRSNATPIDAADILKALGKQAAPGIDRKQAIARFLSVADDWPDACATLGGAFAEPLDRKPLSDRKGR